MNRQEFFRRLEYLLRGISENERMDALAYYSDYFDDAGVENEEQVIQELGSPEAVAQIILEDYYSGQQNTHRTYTSPEMEHERNTQQGYDSYGEQTFHNQNRNEQKNGNASNIIDKIKNMDKSTRILVIILLVFTFPVWIGVVAGLFGAVVGVAGGLFGTVVAIGGSGIGLFVGGLACLVVGLFRAAALPLEGVILVGFGALVTAIGILFILLCSLLLFKWLPALIRGIVKGIKGLFCRQEGGSEI